MFFFCFFAFCVTALAAFFYLLFLLFCYSFSALDVHSQKTRTSSWPRAFFSFVAAASIFWEWEMLLLCICIWMCVWVFLFQAHCILTPSFSSPVVVVVVAIVVGAASLPMRIDRYIYIFFILCVDCCLYCMCTAVVVIFVFNSFFVVVCRGLLLLLLLLSFIFLYRTPIYELYSLFECSNVCALIFLWKFSSFVCYSVRWLLQQNIVAYVCVSACLQFSTVLMCLCAFLCRYG